MIYAVLNSKAFLLKDWTVPLGVMHHDCRRKHVGFSNTAKWLGPTSSDCMNLCYAPLLPFVQIQAQLLNLKPCCFCFNALSSSDCLWDGPYRNCPSGVFFRSGNMHPLEEACLLFIKSINIFLFCASRKHSREFKTNQQLKSKLKQSNTIIKRKCNNERHQIIPI